MTPSEPVSDSTPASGDAPADFGSLGLTEPLLKALADVGYEYRSDGTPDGWRYGSSLTHRIEFPAHVGFTVRGDVYYDPSQTLATVLSDIVAMGDWRFLFWYRDHLATVKREDVQRVATTYFKPQNRTLGTFIPTDKPDRVAVPQAPDVEKLLAGYTGRGDVAAGENFDPSPENIERRLQRVTLAGGIQLAMLPKKTRGETVNFNIALHFGDEKSVFGKASVGSLTGSMLNKGTATRSRQEIEDTFDKLRAKVAVGGTQTGATASGQTYRAQLADTLKLTAEILQKPSFPAAELDTRLKAISAWNRSSGARSRSAASIAARSVHPTPVAMPSATDVTVMVVALTPVA